jgi:hypothetical protein
MCFIYYAMFELFDVVHNSMKSNSQLSEMDFLSMINKEEIKLEKLFVRK